MEHKNIFLEMFFVCSVEVQICSVSNIFQDIFYSTEEAKSNRGFPPSYLHILANPNSFLIMTVLPFLGTIPLSEYLATVHTVI